MGIDRMWVHLWRDWSTDREEVVNTITHGLGWLLSLIGAVVLLVRLGGTEWLVGAGCLVYVATLVGVYGMSTLSHACVAPSRKQWFEMLDQAFIYLLIVGTYTPFSLKYFHSSFAWLLLTVMWGLAWYGFFSKMARGNQVQRASLWLHLLLGWMPVIMVPAWLAAIPPVAIAGVIVGGVFYTVGTIFLVFDGRVPHFHALWHLFVIAGSATHYAIVLIYVVGV